MFERSRRADKGGVGGIERARMRTKAKDEWAKESRKKARCQSRVGSVRRKVHKEGEELLEDGHQGRR